MNNLAFATQQFCDVSFIKQNIKANNTQTVFPS